MASEIEELLIPEETTISMALQQMDVVGYKLLIVGEKKSRNFFGLVTIGDIQRAIISNTPLNNPVSTIIRKDLMISTINDNREDIKALMLKYRLVYMPIIDDDKKIVDIIFWEDIIEEESNQVFPELSLPVVIMAGGLGKRLQPLTNILPKPLLPFGEKTILENIIERFTKYNCKDFYISVNYKADLIQFYLDSLKEKDFNAWLFLEDRPLGTAGSLCLLKDKLTKTFFVSNCDILINEDYSAIYNYHKVHNNELTIVASLKQYSIPYGTVESGENGELLALREKPEVTFMLNCGMYILEPQLLNEIPKDTFFHITHLIEQIKGRGGKVGVFPISEKSWTDIGEWPLYSKVLIR
jgi:dTDP-glucose pyrophosphorylase